jgi:hypothetical protein
LNLELPYIYFLPTKLNKSSGFGLLPSSSI